ncbi:MAG TPA: hypothetical protein DCW33_03985, partial [Proteobacteria bacterium]|nr:hypothetical protein [Pseudomonadota bacterium]
TKAFSVDIGTLWGSDAHGRGVNMILENIDTEYGLLIDPDAVLLAPEWDRLLSRELSDGCIAIGSPYPPEYGKQRHQNFPNACIFFFKVAPLLELAIDWEPLFPQKYRNLLMALIKYSGIRIQDYEMGWRVPKAFAKKGYVGKSFKYITPTDSSAVLLQPESDFQEFHWNGEVVASHQRRSQHEFYGTSHSCAWVDALVKYVSDIGIEVKPFVDT